jgi:chitinase
MEFGMTVAVRAEQSVLLHKGCIGSSRFGFTKYWDDNSKVPYLWNPSTKVFYSYEDEVSLQNKCEYVKENNLGGIMFWEISGDHPSEDKSLVSIIYNSFSKESPEPTPLLYLPINRHIK